MHATEPSSHKPLPRKPRTALYALARAILYMPVVLLAGGMAAVAMFPGLAEYAAPLLGGSGASQCAAGSTADSCCSTAASCSSDCAESCVDAASAGPLADESAFFAEPADESAFFAGE